MKTEQLPETTVIEPEKLIGTRWNSLSELFGDRMYVEFVDKINCIYASQPRKYPMTYTVSESKILISGIDGEFILKGDVLFNNNFPAFEKAA